MCTCMCKVFTLKIYLCTSEALCLYNPPHLRKIIIAHFLLLVESRLSPLKLRPFFCRVSPFQCTRRCLFYLSLMRSIFLHISEPSYSLRSGHPQQCPSPLT